MIRLLLTLLVSILLCTPSWAADFVGGAKCQSCHQEEYSLWQGSHHDMAMRHADSESVLGNFEQIELSEQKQQIRL